MQNLHALQTVNNDASWQCPEHEDLSQSQLVEQFEGRALLRPLHLGLLVLGESLQCDNWLQLLHVLAVLCESPSAFMCLENIT